MDKKKADELITGFLEKIYGFAFSKAYSHDEAEELAAEMTSKVYHSLLAAESVRNPEGYVWRICQNTYARYVASVKKQEGISIDTMSDIPGPDVFEKEDDTEEIYTLRREIAFLSALRRDIVFSYYYKDESIRKIATRLNIPEGTVKWHLNRIRKELKEGLSMERHIGKLGLSPVIAANFSHNGTPGRNGGPEYYLKDKLNLNIVYSVFFTPRTIQGIAEELGMTPVFIEDRVNILEDNGFLVRQKGDKFTTYVNFSPKTFSKEHIDNVLRIKKEMAEQLIKEYVPVIRSAVDSFRNVYIPTGNRELFEAACIFFAVRERCVLSIKEAANFEKYIIRTTDGGEYRTDIQLFQECVDPDYKMTVEGDFSCCGSMWRMSSKYPIRAWSADTHLDSREGYWENNLNSDYDFVYEYMNGRLSDGPEDAEKITRLKQRGFLSENGKIMVMMIKGDFKSTWDTLPDLSSTLKEKIAVSALECASQEAKNYPPQMQDLIMGNASGFIGGDVAVMVMDRLYASGTFRPLTDEERITANLIMFSDVLPKADM